MCALGRGPGSQPEGQTWREADGAPSEEVQNSDAQCVPRRSKEHVDGGNKTLSDPGAMLMHGTDAKADVRASQGVGGSRLRRELAGLGASAGGRGDDVHARGNFCCVVDGRVSNQAAEGGSGLHVQRARRPWTTRMGKECRAGK